MKFSTVIGRDEDGGWIVEYPSIPGCVSQGQTKAEPLENIAEAIALCLEGRAERGLRFTKAVRKYATERALTEEEALNKGREENGRSRPHRPRALRQAVKPLVYLSEGA